MKNPRPKTLFIPVLGLLAAVLVLLVIVTATTYINLRTSKEQARRVLDAQAQAVVSGLTAGLRTGWRHWIWQADSLQGLVQEMSRAGDIEFIALLNDANQVLAHSDPAMVGLELSPSIHIPEEFDRDHIHGDMIEDRLYLAGRRLRDDEISLPRMMMGQGMMMGRGGGKGYGRNGSSDRSERYEEMRQARLRELENLPRPAIILVGMKTTNYLQARNRQFQHAMIMGALLFVLGSAAIYFIFVVQNYKTIDRTLTNLSTYTSNIVDNMPNGLITLDHQGHPVMVNRAARRLFGWDDEPESALADDPVITALSDEYAKRTADGTTVIENDFEAVDQSGRAIPLSVSAAGVPAEPGTGLVLIFRDLRQIRELEDQVRQAEKLAAVGRLAAGVAHEVRNPLSSMRGLARFLARDMDEQSREANYLKVMVEEIDRLNRVITGLLDYAKPKQPELASIDINDAAGHTIGLVRDDARQQGVEIKTNLSPEAPGILADRDQAIQSMLNLLLNAQEAMPDGGSMTITTKAQNGWVYFTVDDTGGGIPAEDRSRLADPFFTTKKKGTGLGLAQVAGIMDAHGGRLDIGSAPDGGARVSLVFPVANQDDKNQAV